MSRLIDADALIDNMVDYVVDGYAESRGDFEEYTKMVQTAPTIDAVSEWIPCSERLPKKERATYVICTEGGYICSCRWTNDMYGLGSHKGSEWGWHIMDKPHYAKVVAWMSLKSWWEGADDE